MKTGMKVLVVAVVFLAGLAPAAQGESLLKKALAIPGAERLGRGQYDAPPKREPKALKKHDLVKVIVLDSSTATSEAQLETEKETKIDLNLKSFVDLVGQPPFIRDAVKADPKFKTKYSLETTHEGSTGRLHRIQTVVKAEIVDVLPNGNMLLEGTKTIVINGETQTVSVSGYFRPEDLRADGSILSDNVASLKISYTGVGDVTDAQKPGWLTQVLSFLWPF